MARGNEGRRRIVDYGGPRVKVIVTQEIIDNACRRDSSHCMIADAIKAAVPSSHFRSVDVATIRFTDPEKRMRFIWLTPRIAQEKLVQFDQGKKVQPFSFWLRSAAQVIDIGRVKVVEPRSAIADRQRVVNPKGVAAGNVPTRVEGRPPPSGALSNNRGRIRTFGLRALKA